MAVRAPANPSSASGVFSVRTITSRATPRTAESRYFQVKRVVDVVLSAVILVCISPVLALTALAVKLSSPGPVLYPAKRVGKNGQPFVMYKFRSMQHNCSSASHEAAISSYMADEKIDGASDSKTPYKLANDSRITRIGAFIRKTSIDELPQLWNVLTGEMSLVGPRPPVQYEVDRYDDHASQRLLAKPGITGPWQVYGRNRVTFSKMIEMDVEYLDNRSILYDLKLIALTIPAALKGR